MPTVDPQSASEAQTEAQRFAYRRNRYCMPQFSLIRLFVSVTLIAVGCGLLATIVPHLPDCLRGAEFWATFKWITAGSLIGGGTFNLFCQGLVGGIAGVGLQIAIAFVII